MTAARESQTYTCYSKGCTSGGSFSAAPESWWFGIGKTPPRHCPTCREWVKAQIDDTSPCTACSWPIPISAKRKISFHKKEGIWTAPTLCARCELNPASAERTAGAKQRIRRLERPREANKRSAERLVALLERRMKYPGQPQRIVVNPDATWWRNTSRTYIVEGVPTVQTIWHHIVERHGDDIQNFARLSSPAHVVPYISQLAASTDGSRVIQFTQGRKMVKLDVMTKVALIFDPTDGVPVTCFAPDNGQIDGKLAKGVWS